MSQNKKNLLVTFADRNFIPQAQALLAGAYLNGGWDGDYMILTPDMTADDVKRFEAKGIMVNVKEIPVDTGNLKKFPATIYLIFHLFSEEFKKWQNILYLDVDTLVRADLAELTRVSGFAAAAEVFNGKLKSQFDFYQLQNNPYSPAKHLGLSRLEYQQKFKELKKNYDLTTTGFNAGVMAFNTDIIKSDTFSSLIEINKKYGKIVAFPPQGELNLFFYKKWQKLPVVYNAYAFIWNHFYKIPLSKIDGIILHLVQASEKNVKPWETSSFFYQQWCQNLDAFPHIDFSSPKKPSKSWSPEAIDQYCGKIRRRQLLFDSYLKFDRLLGLLGLWLKNNFPGLYFFLKRYVKREK